MTIDEFKKNIAPYMHKGTYLPLIRWSLGCEKL